MMSSVRTVACPRCGQLSEFSPANKWRPFCSERCKMIDLGAWASENYRIPDTQTPVDENDTDPDKPPYQ